MSVRCGNTNAHANETFVDGHHHETTAQVRLCFARPTGIKSIEEVEYDAYLDEEAAQETNDAYEAEMAYERYLEDGGPMAEIIWWENERERLMYGY